jgi:hypothetical protein
MDYRGYRVTAQSIIPGILEREQEQSVVYGSIDFGKNVISHPKYLELVSNEGMFVQGVVLRCKDIDLFEQHAVDIVIAANQVTEEGF